MAEPYKVTVSPEALVEVVRAALVLHMRHGSRRPLKLRP